MKLIIDIDEEEYQEIMNNSEVLPLSLTHHERIIKNGIPYEGWNPVSDRLPKCAGVYRVTRYFPDNIMNHEYLVDACFFDGSSTWHNDNRINHDRAYVNNVIAWQEDPEPYKTESEDI